jgi:lipid II:glycine glycyltransferase (peptidoglycan interpeptide bridge formation enzyme)
MGDVDSYRLHVVAAEDDDSTWDAFLATMPRAPYQQSCSWARAKARQGWRCARTTIRRDGVIQGGAQLLYKRIPFAGAVGFVARGPVLGSDDHALAATAAVGLERLAAECDVTYLIVQTPRERAEIMAPHNTMTDALDLSQGAEAILAAMRSSTRRNVRLAQRRGVIVRKGAGPTCRCSIRC